MKKLTLSVLSLLSLSFAQPGIAADSDPCTNPKTVALNSWLLSVNDNDVSSKADIVQSLKLLATGGFSVGGVFAYDFVENVTFAVDFNPGYWADPERAAEAKEKVLSTWTQIPGNTLECNGLVFPTPAIGVQN